MPLIVRRTTIITPFALVAYFARKNFQRSRLENRTLLHNEPSDSSCPVALQLDNIIIPPSVTTCWKRIPGRDWRIVRVVYGAFEGPIARNGCRVGLDRAHVVVLSRRQEREEWLANDRKEEKEERNRLAKARGRRRVGKTRWFLTIIIASGICRGFVVVETKTPQGWRWPNRRGDRPLTITEETRRIEASSSFYTFTRPVTRIVLIKPHILITNGRQPCVTSQMMGTMMSTWNRLPVRRREPSHFSLTIEVTNSLKNASQLTDWLTDWLNGTR